MSDYASSCVYQCNYILSLSILMKLIQQININRYMAKMAVKCSDSPTKLVFSSPFLMDMHDHQVVEPLLCHSCPPVVL